MSERRLSVGINVSILVILTIFGVLLSLPLRLLLYTNYYTREHALAGNESDRVGENVTMEEVVVIPVDYRKLRRCPNLRYEDRLKSVFRSDYDGNCTYVRVNEVEEEPPEERELMVKEEKPAREQKEPDAEQAQETKDAIVAGHILVTMLLASAIAALVEVLRIRFAKDKLYYTQQTGLPPSKDDIQQSMNSDELAGGTRKLIRPE